MANKNSKLLDDLISSLVQDDTVEIEKYGKTWEFKLINSKDYLAVLNNSKKYKEDEATRLYSLQVEIIRIALVSLNGIVLTDVQKDRIVTSVSPVIIANLYTEYEKLRKDSAVKLEKPVEEETDEQVQQTEEVYTEQSMQEKKPKRNVIDA